MDLRFLFADERNLEGDAYRGNHTVFFQEMNPLKNRSRVLEHHDFRIFIYFLRNSREKDEVSKIGF